MREELEQTYRPCVLGGQLADAADHVQLALERVLVGTASEPEIVRSISHEQLPDDRAAGAGDLARVLGTDRHVAPAEQTLALRRDGPLEQRLQARAGRIVLRQEAHQHPVLARLRQLEVHDGAQQLVGHLHEDPRAVARARVGAVGAAVLEVLQGRDRFLDDLVRRAVVQARDHAHAARIVLEAGVVESDGLWRLHGVRGHGSAPLGRCIPCGWADPGRLGGHLRRSQKA